MSIDLRHNPGYTHDQAPKFKKVMKSCFFTNIAHEVLLTEKYETRINTEWIVPDCIGIPNNRLDDTFDGHITAK
jgi:hypothetical protein